MASKKDDSSIVVQAELWWVKTDPKKPAKGFEDKGPQWEAQLRFKEKAKADQLKALGFQVKLAENEDGSTYYRLNVSKRATDRDGNPKDPVRVVDAKLRPIQGEIGNGSVGNVRLFRREYTNTKTGKQGFAPTLMAIQVTKLVPYVARAFDDFDELDEDTEVVEVPMTNDDVEDDRF